MKNPTKPQNGPTWRAVLPYLRSGHTVIGIDEVGRGAWAGPVVAAAVVLPPKLKLPYVNDSKLLSPRRRELLNREIRRQALAIGIGWVAAAEVDQHGLSWAVRESGLRALAGCGLMAGPYMVILDGKHNYLKGIHPSETHIKSDGNIVPVAAASIIAKVARDRYMAALARQLPSYGFERHKGYGTRVHQLALREHGLSAHHRHSWAPFKTPDIFATPAPAIEPTS